MSPTPERVREVFRYDPDTGDFSRRRRGRGPLPRPGTKWRAMALDGQSHQVTYLIWLYVFSRTPSGTIDHINTDASDNRMANLREIPFAGNVQNQRRAHRQNRSGVLGVEHIESGRWRARINVGGRYLHLGVFDTKDEASAAYHAAKRQHHPFWAGP